MADEVVIGKGRIVRVEQVIRDGNVGTESLIDFGKESAMLEPGLEYSSLPIRTVVMRGELKYGVTYDVVLRESIVQLPASPLMAPSQGGRKFKNDWTDDL